MELNYRFYQCELVVKKTAEKVPAQQDRGLQPLIILVQFFDLTRVAFHFSQIQEKCEENFVFLHDRFLQREDPKCKMYLDKKILQLFPLFLSPPLPGQCINTFKL
jgi:hypothetical protein